MNAPPIWTLYPRLIVVDTETTGFLPHGMLAEIGAVCIDRNGHEMAAFSSLVRRAELPAPGEDRGVDAALECNGITRVELQAAPPFPAVRVAFAGWCSMLQAGDAPVPCVAYNTAFDAAFLPWLAWADAPRGFLCLMREAVAAARGSAATLVGESPPAKGDRWALAAAMRAFGVVQPPGAHRALADARAAAALATALRAHIRAAHRDVQP